MTRNGAQSRLSRVLAAVAGIGLVVAVGVTAAQPIVEPVEAAWADSQHAGASASALTVESPEDSLSCVTRGGGLLQPPRYAEISWSSVEMAAEYKIMMRNAAGTEHLELTPDSPTTFTTVDVDAGLLNGLIGTVINLLLGGGTAYIYVVAVHESGWESEPSEAVAIRRAGLIGALLGGLQCAS